MPAENQLLRRYVTERSQEAFAELVRQHVDLVYGAALRRVGGDSHLANDVTQTVFADLARKAASLQHHAVLTGWLYTSTRFAASRAVRSEQRRRIHEREAHAMQELHSPPATDWEQLRPVIDGAMDELNARDREALLLRFFEERALAEVGAQLALSPDAARMRIERALERLRTALARRGIASTATALAGVFAGHTSSAAPAELVTTIVASAPAHAGAAATSAFAAWKIAALGGAAALVVVGVARYLPFATEAEPTPVVAVAAPTAMPAPVAAATASYESISVPADEVEPASPSPTTPASRPVLAAKAAPVAAPDFGQLTPAQQTILQTFWVHHQESPNARPLGWGFRPRPDTPAADSFPAATTELERLGLVRVIPATGMVLLTQPGWRYCRTHAKQLDALPARKVVFQPLQPAPKS